ncbi:MAG: hypothetical protein JSR48_00985 [Verrucomicrobia bacterium]|nr:hypothetical protein [Verrucomicrobiota bacterium]
MSFRPALRLRPLRWGAALVAGATLAFAADPAGLATLTPDLPAAEKVRRIEAFVDGRYYDAAGLMYSHINWREERPFRADDFSAKDSTMPGPEPHEWLGYENSAFISGVYLLAQCYRYEATHDPAALASAARAFGSLDANYRLSERRDPRDDGPSQKAGIMEPASGGVGAGFFCKPYYGRATDHTSTEQHFWPVLALYRYLPLAPAATRARITQMLGEISRRWRGGYRINYFGESWDMEQSNPRAQRHMFLWSVIHRIAFEVTRDRASYDEYARLNALFGAMPTPRETAWGLGRPSYLSTEDRSFHVQIVAGAEILAQLEPAQAARCRRAMAAWWDYSQIGQRDDLLSYYFIEVQSDTGAWRKLPRAIRPRALWRSSYLFQNATLPVCWFGTRERQAFSSAVVADQVPERSAAARARLALVYRGLGKEQLKWFADPEGVMPDELRWMLNVLQGDALAFYSLGYWYARVHGIELE